MAKHFISTSKERGTFPFSFDTMNDLILEAVEHAKKRRTPFTNYALFVDLQQCLCIGLFGQENDLREWLVGSLDTQLNQCSRLMRVGKIEELIGERLIDWGDAPNWYVWGVAHNTILEEGQHIVFGDVDLCWLNIGDDLAGKQSSVVLKAQGCNRESRSLKANEIDFLRSRQSVRRVIEHRWFGVVSKNEWGVANTEGSLNLPHGTHNFHFVVTGNYSMLYIPHLVRTGK